MSSAASEKGFSLTDAQRLEWLRLIRSENVGPRTFRTLLNRYGGAGAALKAIPHLPPQRGRTLVLASVDDCQREMESLARMGARLIALGEDDYPYALRMIDAPPPLISVMGSVDIFKRPMVSFVGSRNASAVGLAFTERLVRAIGAERYVIVSGLARGIDARAHQGALSSGTIAVVAGGLDRIYPSDHTPLLDAIIAQGGAAISEMPLGWEPRGRDFPRRNRIVAGLSLATIVIEAARRSGSLITARFAAEMGREVFAVPGSPLDPRAEGTNDLIRQGASMCVSAEDVINAMRPLIEKSEIQTEMFRDDETPSLDQSEPLWDEWIDGEVIPHSNAGQEFDEPEQKLWHQHLVHDETMSLHGLAAAPSYEQACQIIVDLLGPSPIGIDDLVRVSGVEISLVHQILLDLEMSGRIERQRGQAIILLS
jgi:DNA processing protein